MSRTVDPRLLRAVPSVRRLLVALVGLALLGSAATVVLVWQLAAVIARIVLHGRGAGSLVQPLAVFAVAAILRACAGAAQEWLVGRASLRVRSELRAGVLLALDRLGPMWLARQPSGRLVAATGPGLEALDGYVTRALPALVSSATVPFVMLAAIAWADWRSAAILLVVLPLVPVFMVLVGVTTRRRMEERYAALGRLAGHFLDLVQGLGTLKIYGQARRQVETVRAATESYRRQTMATLGLAFLSGLVLDLIATLSVAVVAVAVGLRLDAGRVGLGAALVTLLLTPEVFAPLRAVGAQYHAAEEGRVAAAAALDILDEAGPALQPVGPRKSLRINGSLQLEGLSVEYQDRSTPALDGVSLTIPSGQVLAVRGVSGGGKTTLICALLGFVEPTRGRILVGSTDGQQSLADIDRARWRSQVAWVPQRPVPTQETVGAEAALGDPAATAVQVLAALADCHAPHPDTELGEDGASISAGQRRRVALARALLRARSVRARGDVPLVLLDEPTEDLDRETEQVVAAVVSGLAGWSTVIVVTHSRGLLTVADRVLDVAAGRLVGDTPRQRLPVQSVPLPEPAAHRPAPAVPASAVDWRCLLVGGRAVRRGLARAAVFSAAAGLAGLALTATSVWLICRAAQHPNLQALAIAVVGVRTFALARALLRYADRLVSHDVALRLLSDLRARVFTALEPLAPAGLVELRRGDLLRRFISDVDGVQDGLVRALVPLFGAAVTAFGAVVLTAALSPAAAGLLAAGLVVAIVVAPSLSWWVSGDATAQSAAAGLRDERTASFVSGLAELSAYGGTAEARARIDAADAVVVAVGRRSALGAAVGAALAGTAAALTVVAVLLTGARAVSAGSLGVTGIGVLAAASLVSFDSLAGLSVGFAAWSRCRCGLERVAAVLATPAPVPEPAWPVAAPVHSPSLVADLVCVAPAAAATVVLSDVSLVVRPGDRVALMGPSGSGKSTLLAAVLRLLPLVSGSLELTQGESCTPLTSLLAEDLPPLVAGSLQGDHVFDTTLRDNLRVVRPAAGDDELDAAAERAGLLTFIRDLPLGWSSPAGADGAALSGGQRQRLLLARALLANPAVLVLDEPTAHLDEVTAAQVLADLLDGTRGSTVLMSTHRPVPPDELDAVLHIRDGRLAGASLASAGLP